MSIHGGVCLYSAYKSLHGWDRSKSLFSFLPYPSPSQGIVVKDQLDSCSGLKRESKVCTCDSRLFYRITWTADRRGSAQVLSHYYSPLWWSQTRLRQPCLPIRNGKRAVSSIKLPNELHPTTIVGACIWRSNVSAVNAQGFVTDPFEPISDNTTAIATTDR